MKTSHITGWLILSFCLGTVCVNVMNGEHDQTPATRAMERDAGNFADQDDNPTERGDLS